MESVFSFELRLLTENSFKGKYGIEERSDKQEYIILFNLQHLASNL